MSRVPLTRRLRNFDRSASLLKRERRTLASLTWRLGGGGGWRLGWRLGWCERGWVDGGLVEFLCSWLNSAKRRLCTHQALERVAAEGGRRHAVDVKKEVERPGVFYHGPPAGRHLDGGHVLGAVVQQGAHKVKREAGLGQLGALGVCKEEGWFVRGEGWGRSVGTASAAAWSEL
jgi:hypothetical protein